jgi:endonuclease/exonuclease/phosphatase family metal-dependent hydrolase
MPSLATFNANNLFLRYKFTRNFPGARSKSSQTEAAEAGLLGYLPGMAFGRYPSSYVVWDVERRELLQRALVAPDGRLPDILCFQEVENIQAIRILNQRYFGDYYPHSLLIDGYDTRNIDVGLLSRFPIREIHSQIDELNDDQERIFSRDCLEAQAELPGGEPLTILINHLKSKFVERKAGDSDSEYEDKIRTSHKRRLAQAEWVASYVQKRFWGEHTTALYAVVGDFNDTPESPWVAPLVNSPLLTDLLSKHRPLDDRWTYYYRSKNQVSQIDYVLASSPLAGRVGAVVAGDPKRTPHIERQGLGFRELNASGQVLPKEANLVHFEADPVTPAPPSFTPPSKVPFRFERFSEVCEDWKRNISDHCPVKVWF